MTCHYNQRDTRDDLEFWVLRETANDTGDDLGFRDSNDVVTMTTNKTQEMIQGLGFRDSNDVVNMTTNKTQEMIQGLEFRDSNDVVTMTEDDLEF